MHDLIEYVCLQVSSFWRLIGQPAAQQQTTQSANTLTDCISWCGKEMQLLGIIRVWAMCLFLAWLIMLFNSEIHRGSAVISQWFSCIYLFIYILLIL